MLKKMNQQRVMANERLSQACSLLLLGALVREIQRCLSAPVE